MTDTAAIGEVLIDFIAKEEGPLEKVKDFEKHPGGAPANVVVGLSRLGVSSALISRVGKDPFGRFLINALTNENIDISQIQLDTEHHTGIVFVQLQKAKPEFLLYKNVAYNFISYSQIDQKFITNLKILHFGSVLFREEPSRKTTFRTVSYARAHGVSTSFDVNIRKDLWKGKEDEMWKNVQAGVELADIVKFSEEEFTDFAIRITNKKSKELQTYLNAITSLGPKLIVITRGSWGCIIAQGNNMVSIDPFKVTPVDTTGAGDVFMAALIASVLKERRINRLGKLTREELIEIGKFSVKVAAISTLRRGAWSTPTLDELKRYNNISL